MLLSIIIPYIDNGKPSKQANVGLIAGFFQDPKFRKGRSG